MISGMIKLISLIIGVSVLTNCSVKQEETGNIPLNQFQIIGSHNSYKKAIDEDLLEFIAKDNPLIAASLDYSHLNLEDQLNLGLRSMEFDLFYDPEGGKYSDPLGYNLLLEMNIQPEPYDTNKRLEIPGLKVLHAQDIDFRSHHLLFKDALTALKNWSDENTDHFPIIITIEPKDGVIELPGSEKPIPFDSAALYSIDEEILEVIGESRLITPDFVKNGELSLELAILNHGWPKLDKVKGMFMFVLDAGEVKRTNYLKSHEGETVRVMFVTAPEGDPEAAFMIINNPVSNKVRISELVKSGYIIRTRSDANTVEARNNDYSRFEAAKESGAQIISTDYYLPDPELSNYTVRFGENKYLRLNPLFD